MNLTPNTVKICSLRTPVHAGWVVEAGADLFGLIFADARRRVSHQVAREIVDEARRLDSTGGLRATGVFAGQTVDEINRTADSVGLDLVQIHASDVAPGQRLERPAIIVVRTRPDMTLETVMEQVGLVNAGGSAIAGIHVEGFKAGTLGGSGTLANWDLAREIASAFPILLAGGLHPGNVEEAIRAVAPAGVDVSSGVETDGEKDRARIIAFTAAARRAMTAPSFEGMNAGPFGESAQPIECAQPLL